MYTPCTTSIAANIAKDCSHPQVGGYTGRAVLIPLDYSPIYAISASNPRTITGITLGASQNTIVVDNVWPDPFNGSTTESNADNGRIGYTKTFAFRIPLRGSDVSRDIVEPLVGNALGFLAIIEKVDKVGNGSYEVVGYLSGLKANADGISRDESSNDGDINVTMSCTEGWFETTFFATDYATTKAAFEALIALAI